MWSKRSWQRDQDRVDGPIVRTAIAATFARRGTLLPAETPIGLTDAFANDPQKIALWQAFIGREPLLLNPGDLVAATEDIAAFVLPLLHAAGKGAPFRKRWRPGGPWHAARGKR